MGCDLLLAVFPGLHFSLDVVPLMKKALNYWNSIVMHWIDRFGVNPDWLDEGTMARGHVNESCPLCDEHQMV